MVFGSGADSFGFFPVKSRQKKNLRCKRLYSENQNKLVDNLKLNGATRKLQMHPLIDSTSLETLKILSLDVEFLTGSGSHPSVWKKSPNYMEMKTKVDALKVVNDTG
jgi:hypothetical protein